MFFYFYSKNQSYDHVITMLEYRYLKYKTFVKMFNPKDNPTGPRPPKIMALQDLFELNVNNTKTMTEDEFKVLISYFAFSASKLVDETANISINL
jgi:hypothetical protein